MSEASRVRHGHRAGRRDAQGIHCCRRRQLPTHSTKDGHRCGNDWPHKGRSAQHEAVAGQVRVLNIGSTSSVREKSAPIDFQFCILPTTLHVIRNELEKKLFTVVFSYSLVIKQMKIGVHYFFLNGGSSCSI